MDEILPQLKKSELSPRKIQLLRNLPKSGLVRISKESPKQKSNSPKQSAYMQLVPSPSALVFNIMFDIQCKKKLHKIRTDRTSKFFDFAPP